MKISSKDNPAIKYLFKIYDSKKERDLEGKFIVEGYNMVEEASKASLLLSVYGTKPDKRYPSLIEITPEILKKVTDAVNPEGIIGLVKKPEKRENDCKILYLDHLQDPGNLGTLLRSALAFNFKTVILDSTVDLYNPKTLRASEGAIFHLNFSHSKLEDLKNEGYQIIGTSLKGEPMEAFKKPEDKFVLILGNEGNGVSDELLKASDHILTITTENVHRSAALT